MKMRIGEILLVQEAVDALVLKQTLKERGVSRQRLVSSLVNRAQLDSDDGAMALSEQLGYPAALQRHLERRDPKLEQVIPRELIQRWAVLPLGRAHDGRLVVVARDPTPILCASLEHASRESIVLAVAPGIHLERLIQSIYGTAVDQDDPAASPSGDGQVAELDMSIDPTAVMSRLRGRTVSYMFKDAGPELPIRATEEGDHIDRALGEIEHAITAAAAARIAMEYASRRWRAALMLSIDEALATARRGHGHPLDDIEAIVVPLAMPSLIQRAHDTASATMDPPRSTLQDQLVHWLGDASEPAAAPVIVRNRVHAVIAVGDPLRGKARDALADLARIADALGSTHERLAPT